jgi:hypothetical protein
MGTWQIVITGHGIHHNGRQDDAETMAAVFVGELRAAGHEVNGASFVLTSMDTDLLPLVPAVENETWKERRARQARERRQHAPTG